MLRLKIFYLPDADTDSRDNGINIYLFIKDHINQGGMEFKYCHTSKTWEDVLKKSKQEKFLREFEEELMNVEVDYYKKV